jgi:hypothetical protein
MDRPKLEVADVFRRYGEAYRQNHGASMSAEQRRVMAAIEVCRTAVLGGHLERCDQCDYERNCFNSCRDRHCPKCQSLARAQWIEHRQAELLECPYFHVVFTVPEEIAAIAYQNKEVVYEILFHSTAETLKTIAADPKHLGAEIGFFAVLHSWGQNLMFHPHLHCVVPGGGLSADGQRWIRCRARFFLSVRVLSRLFRRLFLERIEKAFNSGKLHFFASLEFLRDPRAFAAWIASAKESEWVVYAKRPFAGPQQVLDYVGRYASRGPLQQPPDRYRQRSGAVSLEGLSRQQPDQSHGPGGRRVHPAISASCLTRGLSTHSLLWLSGKPRPAEEVGPVSPTARDADLIPNNFGQGLSRTISATHRTVVDPLSPLSEGPDGDR